ncbi:DUF3179 domain-containing protein [Gymnodinialimonas sp. 2305UL16-5]|uniref:DUF3179 domain-containing protein n=1 Tax=Gymnodinialimonas mytili TaxID=3126503 RepID=UPI0030B39BEC
MSITRRTFLSATAATTALGPQAVLAQAEESTLLAHLNGLLTRNPITTLENLAAIRNQSDLSLATSLIFASRFARGDPGAFDSVLASLTGADHAGWFEWMLWQEQNPQIASHLVYYEFKRQTLFRIDPNWERFLLPQYVAPDSMRIRFEELTWGGVVLDGIPSLDNPDLITADEASYLLEDDLVFGVSINGDTRAYPLRIMGWHEMFNEVIGGVPVALAYCTLCGAGILFETQLPSREDPLVFGSSGFLYRSNKLMFDRQTDSLWNQFTGQPVSGPLVDSGIELAQRPVVITEWSRWRADNPDTRVLSVNTGFARDYGPGVVYRDYFASDDLMFPTLVDETEHRQKSYVFGVRLAGGAKAYPLEAFEGGRVINDQVGFHNLVLVGDAASRSVRAYDRGDLEFGQDLSADGVTWTQTEDALVAPDGRRAPRVAGHISYWFAWQGYLGSEADLWRE